ncbi:hypothetical protein [Chryseobacterium sp. PMSZPI]|uniref:hypothetical protein n=1 Tax=Chryseobacterium sp. PMSZPI TaxID=1033900 RepID=UPI001054FA2D|nr:hypothetical protein [Chryseobacterium sp. PMSZPI]
MICSGLGLPVCAQVGINTPVPTQALDVNGNARVRTMTDINTNALTLQYNRKVMQMETGILGLLQTVL